MGIYAVRMPKSYRNHAKKEVKSTADHKVVLFDFLGGNGTTVETDRRTLEMYLNEGYEFHPHKSVVTTDDAILIMLVKYTPEEKAQFVEKPDIESVNVESLIDVPLSEVDTKLKEGYEVIPDKIYAKSAVLIKKRKAT